MAPAIPLVGTNVAHYEIAAKLGGGGMGVVYKAADTKLGRQVALKFLPPEWSHDEQVKQRFIREAQAASATDHPNICPVHSIESTSDDQLFIVMAYCDGQTLKERLEQGPIGIDERSGSPRRSPTAWRRRTRRASCIATSSPAT
jgi:serine/threonine protein kinase